ncbi:MAG: hypothetical protein H7A33_04225 [Deltaproteobacteria bacterium]|nr:hypothetical protein [Deltaproteobacteria bacterium]
MLFLSLLVWGGVSFLPAVANATHPRYNTAAKVKGKVMKHFDRDEDGVLNRYELSLYQTHKHFGYPLAKKKKQKPYDFNGDLMLQPYEEQLYNKDKAAGNLRKFKKNKDQDQYEIVVNPQKIKQ